MNIKYDLNRTKLLNEAPRLIKWAIDKGLMSYPLSQKYHADGTLDPNIENEDHVDPIQYTPEFCERAYELRQLGMTLDDTAKAVNVSRGSITYILAKGHEHYLSKQRANLEHEQSHSSNQHE
jgi:hypothetical protein